MKSFRLVVGIVFFLALIFQAYSSVEVFSQYDTQMQVFSNNSIQISKDLTLKNVYDVGIVPGQIEFKVGRGTEGSIGSIDISAVTAVDSFGNEIKSQVRSTSDYSVIILDVYYPLLPGFEYAFSLNYTLSYEPGGIFFKSLQIPLRESSIPIEKGEFKVVLPENYHFTHLTSDGGEAQVVEGNAVWEIIDDTPRSVSFEYSYLPISFGGIKGSYFFWVGLNVLLLLFLIFEIRKEIRRVRAEYETQE